MKEPGRRPSRSVFVVTPPPDVFAAVVEQVPRDDRDTDARVFGDVNADPLRTAIGKACRAAGVPVFSPHDLRHRRVSLMHAGGISWARIGEAVGHSPRESADTYTHVMVDETAIDYGAILAGTRRELVRA